MLISSVLFLSILHLCKLSAGIPDEKIEKLRQLMRKIPDNSQINLNPPNYLQYLSVDQLEVIKEICPDLTANYTPSGVSQLISRFELNVDVQLFVIADVLAQALKIYAKSHEDSIRRQAIIKIMQQKRQEREEKNRLLEQELEQARQEILTLKEENSKELENLQLKFQSQIEQQSEEFAKKEQQFLQEQQIRENAILDLQKQLEELLKENERLKEALDNNGFILAEQRITKIEYRLPWGRLLLIGLCNLILSFSVVLIYRRHVKKRLRTSFN